MDGLLQMHHRARLFHFAPTMACCVLLAGGCSIPPYATIRIPDTGVLYKPRISGARSWPRVPGGGVRVESDLLYVYCHTFDQFTVEAAQSDYCWAACVEAVLRYDDIRVSQHELVARAHKGREGAFGGSFLDLINGIAGFYTSNLGNVMVVPVAIDDSYAWVDRVSNEFPVIVGVRGTADGYGHTLVVFGVWFSVQDNPSYYEDDEEEDEREWEPVFHSFTVYDPAPGMGIYEIDAATLRNTLTFAVTFDSTYLDWRGLGKIILIGIEAWLKNL